MQPSISGAAPRSGWRFFPWAIAGTILFVIAVNAVMITTAVRGFPGRIGRNGFDLSNQYNAILAEAERAAALGWSLHTALRDGKLVLHARDAAGQALQGVSFTVEAQRPVGPPAWRLLTFLPEADGSCVSTSTLEAGGQWDLLITLRANGAEMHATRRLHML